MKKIPRSWLFFIFVSGFAWASETDAEILKDLDFFMNFDVVREEVVFEESPIAIDENPKGVSE